MFIEIISSLSVLVLGAVPVLLRASPGVPGLPGSQIAPIPHFSSFEEKVWILDPTSWISAPASSVCVHSSGCLLCHAWMKRRLP